MRKAILHCWSTKSNATSSQHRAAPRTMRRHVGGPFTPPRRASSGSYPESRAGARRAPTSSSDDAGAAVKASVGGPSDLDAPADASEDDDARASLRDVDIGAREEAGERVRVLDDERADADSETDAHEEREESLDHTTAEDRRDGDDDDEEEEREEEESASDGGDSLADHSSADTSLNALDPDNLRVLQSYGLRPQMSYESSENETGSDDNLLDDDDVRAAISASLRLSRRLGESREFSRAAAGLGRRSDDDDDESSSEEEEDDESSSSSEEEDDARRHVSLVRRAHARRCAERIDARRRRRDAPRRGYLARGRLALRGEGSARRRDELGGREAGDRPRRGVRRSLRRRRERLSAAVHARVRTPVRSILRFLGDEVRRRGVRRGGGGVVDGVLPAEAAGSSGSSIRRRVLCRGSARKVTRLTRRMRGSRVSSRRSPSTPRSCSAVRGTGEGSGGGIAPRGLSRGRWRRRRGAA